MMCMYTCIYMKIYIYDVYVDIVICYLVQLMSLNTFSTSLLS